MSIAGNHDNFVVHILQAATLALLAAAIACFACFTFNYNFFVLVVAMYD